MATTLYLEVSASNHTCLPIAKLSVSSGQEKSRNRASTRLHNYILKWACLLAFMLYSIDSIEFLVAISFAIAMSMRD